jgi:hypothetical protein
MFLSIELHLSPTSAFVVIFSNSKRKRKNRELEHTRYVEKTMNSTVLSLYAYEHNSHYNKINNTEFCYLLKKDWFTNSTMIDRAVITNNDRWIIELGYKKYVYNVDNFPYTYRQENETYKLSMNFTDVDVRMYYRENCPFYDYEKDLATFDFMMYIGIIFGVIGIVSGTQPLDLPF